MNDLDSRHDDPVLDEDEEEELSPLHRPLPPEWARLTPQLFEPYVGCTILTAMEGFRERVPLTLHRVDAKPERAAAVTGFNRDQFKLVFRREKPFAPGQSVNIALLDIDGADTPFMLMNHVQPTLTDKDHHRYHYFEIILN